MDIEDCIDYCSEFINVDDARKELEALKQERDHCLWFLAELINERETKKEGYSMPVRWLCLREDLAKKYIEEAQAHVTDWCADEQAAFLARETHSPYIAPNKRVQADADPREVRQASSVDRQSQSRRG